MTCETSRGGGTSDDGDAKYIENIIKLNLPFDPATHSVSIS